MEIIVLICFLLLLCFLNNHTIENFGNQLLLPDFTKSIFVGRNVYDNKIKIKFDKTKKPSEVEAVTQPPYSEVDFNNLIGTEDTTMVDREIYSKLETINEDLDRIENINLENIKSESKYLNRSICGKRNMQIVNPPGANNNLLSSEEREFLRSIKIPESCLWSGGTIGEGDDDDGGCGQNSFAICSDNIVSGFLSNDQIKQQCMNKNSSIWRNCKRFCCQNLLFPPDLGEISMTPEQRVRYELFTNNITEFKPFTLEEIIYEEG